MSRFPGHTGIGENHFADERANEARRDFICILYANFTIKDIHKLVLTAWEICTLNLFKGGLYPLFKSF